MRLFRALKTTAKSMALRTAPRAITPVRQIVNVSSLRGTYDALSRKTLSPLNGAVFTQSGALHRLYELAQIDAAKINSQVTATNKLVNSLFYKLGEQFRPTQNKSNPAYCLTPTFIAKIMHHITDGSLSLPETQKKLFEEWRKLFKEMTGNTVTNVKVMGMIDLILQSKIECQNKDYPEHLTETILLSFLFFKAVNREDILKYIKELCDLQSIEVDERLLHSHLTYEESDIVKTVQLINQLEMNKVTQENLMVALLLKNNFLPKVIQAEYGYKNKHPVGNCVETGLHNLCNILLYNEKKHAFDFDLLPKEMVVNERFHSFYAMQNFKVDKVNFASVGQAFMDLVSDIEGVHYLSDRYEVTPSKKNFLLIMNQLFGLRAGNLKELSNLFSDHQRQIEFIDVEAIEFIDAESNIKIQIKSDQVRHKSTTFKFEQRHGELVSYDFAANFQSSQNDGLRYLAMLLQQDSTQNTLLLSLLHLEGVTDNQKIYARLRMASSLEEINYLCIHIAPQHCFQAFSLINAIYPHIEKYPRLENYIAYLCNKFNVIPYAVRSENPKLLSAVIKGGADIHYVNEEGQSLLHLTCKTEIIDMLLNEGADPRRTDKFKRTPLHLADDAKQVELYVRKGADVDAQDLEGRTALHNAKELELINMLLRCRANPNVIDANKRTPLHATLYLEQARALIKAGANVNAEDIHSNTPLHFVSDPEVLKLLLENGARPNGINKSGHTALLYLVMNQMITPEIANTLLQAGATLDLDPATKQSVLHYTRDVSMARIWLNAGVKVSVVDRYGREPLHCVNDPEVAKLLIEFGANVNAVDADGKTPIYYARDKRVIQVLEDSGARHGVDYLPQNDRRFSSIQ